MIQNTSDLPLSRTNAASFPGRRAAHAPQFHRPAIEMDGDGTIRSLTPPARHILEYASGAVVRPSFFSHVHARNMYQVMRDMADMVCYGKSRSEWLLCLRTGLGRWVWVRAAVLNRLSAEERDIRIELSPV